MKHSIFIKTVLIVASLPLFAGCVERQVVYRDRPVYVQSPPPGSTVVVPAPPSEPPPQVEVIPAAPDPNLVWIGGYYNYGPSGWIWVGGRWAPRPRPNAVWVHGHWGYHGHNRVWISAGWR